MTLRVTNSLTGELEEFVPQDPDNVLLYYCGLTVSDYPHLGHARSWIHVDILRRWLEFEGYSVRHVENFTDVNEKIVARMGENELGSSEKEVARYFIGEVIRNMRSLNLKRATVYPRVSEHIPEIIELIEGLIDAGYAYESNESVYFDVTAFDEYGQLSNQQIDDIESQGEPSEQAEKRNPADFALWKAGAVSPDSIAEHRPVDLDPIDQPVGQTWESPWGTGRPGWHIECSAMAMTHLADHIDIHVGGQDLVFPHHENEIAQSEAATGDRFVDYWMHVRLLETEGEKMSSSLQNFFTVSNAIEEFGANSIRMFLLSAAYSQPQSYTESALHEAVSRWDRLSRAYDRAVSVADSSDAYATVTDKDFRSAVRDSQEEFRAALNDDLNTRVAIRALFELVTAVHRHLDTFKEYDYMGLREAIEALETFGSDVLGFVFEQPTEPAITEDLIELLLAIREEERATGNFERADDIRQRLGELGVSVEDTEDGSTYRP